MRSTDVRNIVVEHNFMFSGETDGRYFSEVLRAIGELRRELIRLPSLNTHSRITSTSRFKPYFKMTHVHASVPIEHVAAFRGRKPYLTENVLAVVDFDLKFTYVLVGWEGSVHDALILRDALEKSSGLRVPEGKFCLMDAGYATRPGFIAPYRGVKYHLKECSSHSPSNAKELFNLRHSFSLNFYRACVGFTKKSLQDSYVKIFLSISNPSGPCHRLLYFA
ncbi:nuclease HARBI1 [Canna indica]|uniref:Nuclease HARBI1 n=1 Tax=Canna indica TaxID=4628 RepID=A0AAQ3KL69_9LILI|nr:nuclease HARBI1 [Canna indica]